MIEDILPLYDISVSVKLEKKPERVYKAPQNEDIEFSFKGGRAEFKIDRLECHQMVVIE